MNKQYDNNVLMIIIVLITITILILIFYKTKCYIDEEEKSFNKFMNTSIKAVERRKQNLSNQVDEMYDKIQGEIGLNDRELDISNDFRIMNDVKVERDIKRQNLIDTTSDLSNRIDGYISDKLLNNEQKYLNISNYIDDMKNNIDRPIYNYHVNEFIKYKNEKDLKDSSLIDSFINIVEPSEQNITNDTINTINYSIVPTTDNDIVGEEEMLYLYPTKPDDFYGSYEILPYQYKLLDNMNIHLLPTEIKFVDSTQQNYEIKYPIRQMNKKNLPEFPTTTIELLLNETNNERQFINNSKLNDNVIHLIKKRKNLLNELGVNDKIYVFGNDGDYRIYNKNKTLLFNLRRIVTI